MIIKRCCTGTDPRGKVPVRSPLTTRRWSWTAAASAWCLRSFGPRPSCWCSARTSTGWGWPEAAGEPDLQCWAERCTCSRPTRCEPTWPWRASRSVPASGRGRRGSGRRRVCRCADRPSRPARACRSPSAPGATGGWPPGRPWCLGRARWAWCSAAGPGCRPWPSPWRRSPSSRPPGPR